MTSISKRYTEALARLKKLEAQEEIVVLHQVFTSVLRFCPTCDKDVRVEAFTRRGVEVSVVCEVCGTNLLDQKA